MKITLHHPSFFKKRKYGVTKNIALSNFRNSTITFPYIGRKGYIYNGAWSLTKTIEENMVGFKFGEYSITKKFDTHCKKNVKRNVKRNIKNKIWDI